MGFNNKTVFITGGASGIGFLCGKMFASEGANIVLVDVDEKALSIKVDQIRKEKGNVIAIVADVRDYHQIEEARDKAVAAFGSIDIIINSAGGSAVRIKNCRDKEFKDVPIEVYDWGIDVNLKGPFYVNHACFKQLAKQKSGVIINIGSITGEEGCPQSVDYAAAKSAVMFGLTKSLAQYGAKYGVRVVCVSPGPVLTREAMSKMKTIIGRAAEPEEIVNLLMYLASDKASFITGVNYLIDGGRSIMKDKE